MWNGLKKFAIGPFFDWTDPNVPLKTPGGMDLSPSSATIARLNGTPDNVSHASVYGTIPKRNAVWRLVGGRNGNDGSSMIRNKDRVKAVMRACSVAFYNIVVKTATGRTCQFADRAIGSIDERWSEWTHFSNNRSSPTDGLLPRETMLYPYESRPERQIPVEDEDHFSVVYTRDGLNGVAVGMTRIGMPQAGSTSTSAQAMGIPLEEKSGSERR